MKQICYSLSPSPGFGKQSSKFSYVVTVPPIGPLAAAVSDAGTIGGTGSTLWFVSFAILLLLCAG
jgi:hypothetical protein